LIGLQTKKCRDFLPIAKCLYLDKVCVDKMVGGFVFVFVFLMPACSWNKNPVDLKFE